MMLNIKVRCLYDCPFLYHEEDEEYWGSTNGVCAVMHGIECVGLDHYNCPLSRGILTVERVPNVQKPDDGEII